MGASEDISTLLSEFREKANEDAEFRGEMLEFKKTSERRLAEGNTRMGSIEQKMATPGLCQAHLAIVQMLTDAKEDLQQKTRKDEEHDKGIAEVKTDIKIVEYRLTTSDVAKVVAIITPLTPAAVTLVEVIIKRLGGA